MDNTSNRRPFDIDVTSIYRKENVDNFPRHFDGHFQYNFDGRKIGVVLRYFVRRNFNEQNIDVVSMYFF